MTELKGNDALASMAAAPVMARIGGIEVVVRELTMPRALELLRLAGEMQVKDATKENIMAVIASALQKNLAHAVNLIVGQQLPKEQADRLTPRETIALVDAFLAANDVRLLLVSFSAVAIKIREAVLACTENLAQAQKPTISPSESH